MNVARLVVVAGLSLTSAALAQHEGFRGLGHLGVGPGQTVASRAYGVSDDGLIVTGESSSFNPAWPSTTGPAIFRWTQDTGMQVIRSGPESLFGFGYAVSADGQHIVGYAAQSQLYIGQSFRHTLSTGITLMGGLPGPQYTSQAYDVSANGQVIVGSSSTPQTASSSRQTPYQWTQATGMVALPGLYTSSQGWAKAITPDGAVIVGASYYNDVGTIGPRAVRWSSTGVEHLGQLADIPLHSSYATCVSHDGSVIAGYQTPEWGQPSVAFRWKPSQGMHAITFPGVSFMVQGMNATGTVLVGHSFDSGSARAMIWDEFAGLQDLNTRAENLLPAGWTLRTANAITPDGYTIVGEATNASGLPEAYILRFPSSPICCTSDFNGDGDFGTDTDIEAYFACLAGNCCPTCYPGGADFNADGDYGTDADIESFFRVLAGGIC